MGVDGHLRSHLLQVLKRRLSYNFTCATGWRHFEPDSLRAKINLDYVDAEITRRRFCSSYVRDADEGMTDSVSGSQRERAAGYEEGDYKTSANVSYLLRCKARRAAATTLGAVKPYFSINCSGVADSA